MALTPEQDAHLRNEIEKRIKFYESNGLGGTEHMRDILNTRGPLAVLEQYITSPPDIVRGWSALMPDHTTETLEWLAVNDKVAAANLSQQVLEAAKWKLSKPPGLP